MVVLVELARSAAPPASSGRRGASALMARPVRGGAVLLVRRAEADVAVAVDERGALRPLRVRLLRLLEDAADLVEVVRVLDGQHTPAVGAEARRDVVAVGQGGRPVEADP